MCWFLFWITRIWVWPKERVYRRYFSFFSRALKLKILIIPLNKTITQDFEVWFVQNLRAPFKDTQLYTYTKVQISNTFESWCMIFQNRPAAGIKPRSLYHETEPPDKDPTSLFPLFHWYLILYTLMYFSTRGS